MSEYLYRNYVQTISRRFESALSEIQAIYNFDLGDEFEIAICKVLRAALPQKFGICRGHVVSQEGQEAGDDVIIYDTIRFPTLRMNPKDEYSRKEWIPIEAVYAYIEAKNTVNIEGTDGGSLHKAWNQAASVKALCSQRPPVSGTQISPNLNLESPLFSVSIPPTFPQQWNPVFTMILARNVRDKSNGKIIEDAVTIRNQVVEKLTTHSNPIHPDGLVLGREVVGLPVLMKPGNPLGELVSPFFVPGVSTLTIQPLPDISFGIGLSLLLFALDWIQLGKMPWGSIIYNGFNPNVS